jgi:hypothetical protein
MSVMLFIIVLVASFIIVRIGAVAFQLTGLEWSHAKFQSLSCFSGTGFTTKEAELITGDKQRRRIASILMVLGNAGLITLIATAFSALNPENTLLGWLSKSFLPFLPLWSVRWVNMGIIVIAIFIIYKLSTNKKYTQKLTNYLRKRILKKEFFKPVLFEELLLLTGGYGITKVEVTIGNYLIDKTLAESELRKNDITVLAILRGDNTIPNPSAATKIHKSDELVLFGKLENIRDRMSA